MNDQRDEFWNETYLLNHDDLNDDIWIRSPKIQEAIQNPSELINPGSIGAQQAMVEKIILPWVPDLVGKNWRDSRSLIIVGSAYAGFIDEYSTRPMPLEKYMSSKDPLTFQKHFLNYVVQGDNWYYGPIANLAESFDNFSNLAVFDLCRVSFVQRGEGHKNRKDKSGDVVVKKGAKIYEKYAECKESESWLWKRLAEGNAKCVVALGSIAEHGLLRLYKKKNFSVKQYRNCKELQLPASLDGQWVSRYADKTNQCKLGYWLGGNGDWWVIQGTINNIERKWQLLPVFHPASHQRKGNDPGYVNSKRILDIIKGTR